MLRAVYVQRGEQSRHPRACLSLVAIEVEVRSRIDEVLAQDQGSTYGWRTLILSTAIPNRATRPIVPGQEDTAA